MTAAHLNDLQRRLAATRDHIRHLRDQRDRAAMATDAASLRTFAKIERDLKDAEIDAIRLSAVIEDSADQSPPDDLRAPA